MLGVVLFLYGVTGSTSWAVQLIGPEGAPVGNGRVGAMLFLTAGVTQTFQ